jgi:CheY-like chemotaxis protein
MSNSYTFLLISDDLAEVVACKYAFATRPRATSSHLRAVPDAISAMSYINGLEHYSDRLSFPIPDLILCDFDLAKVNGVEFLRWLHQQSRPIPGSIPFMLICGEDTPAHRRELANAAGATQILEKPIHWPKFFDDLLK